MKKIIKPSDTPSTYDPEALYLKAQRYTQRMCDLDNNDWEYALWSGFTLEFLARSALANRGSNTNGEKTYAKDF